MSQQLQLPRICKHCGKRRWPNEPAAIAEAVRRMAGGAPSLAAYQCPKGNNWHLSRRPHHGRVPAPSAQEAIRTSRDVRPNIGNKRVKPTSTVQKGQS